MILKRVLALLLICLLLTGLCPLAFAETSDGADDPDSDGYIVKLREGTAVPLSVQAVARPLGFDMYLVDDPAGAAALADTGAVEYVAENIRLKLFDAAEEPDYKAGNQWYLSGEYGIQPETAWAEGLDGSGVTVAVIDTGLYSQHQDFENTSILRELGYNASGDGGDYTDMSWHGTAVTGVIAASVNGTGIVGGAYGANILPIRIFASNGDGYLSYLIEGLSYAVEQQVDIINLSVGTEEIVQPFADVITAAAQAGIIMVAAVGNDGSAVLNYPAAFPEVIGVGAIESGGTVAGYSQKNASVWVMAPGSDIRTTTSRQSAYTVTRGTSFSTPCVSALAAMAKQYAKSRGQSLTPTEFAQLMRLSAQDAGSAGYDYDYGCGIVNAPRMLEALKEKTVQYELGGGAWPDGTEPQTSYIPYYGGTVQLTAQIPVRDGCFFGGWYTAPDDSGERITEFVPAEGEVQRVYYARWIENVTTLASVTVNGCAAEPAENGVTWTVYYPAGTELPDAETAEVAASFAYTGSKYTLEKEILREEETGEWVIRTTQYTADESYQQDYRLCMDNTSYHAPVLAEGGTGTVLGEAAPAALDGATPAVPFAADLMTWFDDADEAETLRFLLTLPEAVERIVGLTLDGNRLCYTPPAAAAGTQVSFTITAADQHFTGASVDVTVAVSELPLSTPALEAGTGTYDALVPSELQIVFTSYDNTLLGLRADGTELTAGVDYTVNTGAIVPDAGETVPQLDGEPVRTPSVTLQRSYLRTLPNGEAVVSLRFDTGRTAAGRAAEQTVDFVVRVINSCVDGHSWDEGELTLVPDCVTPGERTRHCTVCGETMTEAVEPTEHSYDGMYCTVCGKRAYVFVSGLVSAPEEPALTETAHVDTVQAADGSVTTTTSWTDGRTAVATVSAAGDAAITVTDPNGEIVAALSLTADPAESTAFDDVTETVWYAQDVRQVSAYGLFHGTAERSFSPEMPLTRGMLLTVLHNLSGKPDYGTDSFDVTDVARPAWYFRAVTWGYAAGITSGVTETAFYPEQNVTREQMVTMLYRYAALLGTHGEPRGSLDAFPDGGEVSDYAVEAMEWAAAAGLISGRADRDGVCLAPQGTATRAEAAAILCRFISWLKES